MCYDYFFEKKQIQERDKMGKVIGYTQGTYDMFHIGHLNLIKNAKRRCDYLIVGVNTDELVESYKNKKTYRAIGRAG